MMMKFTPIIIFAILATVNVKAVDSKPLARTHIRYHLENGSVVFCQRRIEGNECLFDEEIEPCETNLTLVKCVSCKPGYRNCIRPSSEFNVRCSRPELLCKPEEVSIVTNLTGGGCFPDCICKKTEGFVRKDGECVKHPTPCGINSTLFNGKCSGCPSGMYKPWEGFQDCIPTPQPEEPVSSVPVPPSKEPLQTSTNRPNDNSREKNFLSPPEQFSGIPLSDSEIFLQWNSSKSVDKVTIVVKANDDPTWKKQVEVSGIEKVQNMTLRNLQPSTVYTVIISATNSLGDTVSSKPIQVATKKKDESEDSKTDDWPWIKIVGIVFGVIGGIILICLAIIIIIKALRGGPVNAYFNSLHVHFNQGQKNERPTNQHPNGPPPAYSESREDRDPHPGANPLSNDLPENNAEPDHRSDPSVNAHLDQPELYSETSSLLNQHSSNGRSSSGPDTTVPKQISSGQNNVVSAEASQQQRKAPPPSPSPNQTFRKRPLDSQGSGASNAGESCTEFGPVAMKGMK